jgi:hypothetical protein
LHLVAIGDSTAQASSCDGCTDFVDLYARAITKTYGIPVEVENRAFEQYGNVPPAQVTHILADVETDASLRTTSMRRSESASCRQQARIDRPLGRFCLSSMYAFCPRRALDCR